MSERVYPYMKCKFHDRTMDPLEGCSICGGKGLHISVPNPEWEKYKMSGMYGKYTGNEMDAALCIWEFCLHQRCKDDDSVFDWLRGGEGTAAARDQCVALAADCDKSYQMANTLGYDDSFDWEFVPRWVRLAMDICKTHDLVDHWIEYIGLEIYREFEKDAMSHNGRAADA